MKDKTESREGEMKIMQKGLFVSLLILLCSTANALTYGKVALVEDGSYIFAYPDMKWKVICAPIDSVSCVIEMTPIHNVVEVTAKFPGIRRLKDYDTTQVTMIESYPKAVFGRDIHNGIFLPMLRFDTVYVNFLRYPDNALKPGIEGWVIVSTIIDTLDRCSNTAVLHSSGNQALDKTALDMINETEYNLVTLAGEKIRAVLLFPIKFDLIYVE